MILLVDNYDSFVHNLARYFRRLGCETLVLRSDQVDAERCRELQPDGIVISPGPKRPEEAGNSIEIIQQLGPSTPILGVCLGHQAIAVAYGGRVVPCQPMHGMQCTVEHDGKDLFAGISNPTQVARYHSLAVDANSAAAPIVITAKSNDGMIMGIRHKDYPVFGVQFHPESILTQQGDLLVENFAALTACELTKVGP